MSSNVHTVLIGNSLVVKDGNSFLVFNPFSSKITRVSKFPEAGGQLFGELKSFGFFGELPNSTLPDLEWRGFSSLTLLTTRKCNLACRYCYASAKPDGEEMPLELAIDSVRWFVDQLSHDQIRVTFHGGGEPTLAMDVIQKVVEYIEARKGNKKGVYIITTNGTAQKNSWDWMMRFNFGISISIDGTPDIQNRNRPFFEGDGSSEAVEDSIYYLVQNKYPFSVRLTYSPADDIGKILRYFACLGIEKIHLEPLFPYGRLYKLVSFGEKSGYEVYSPSGSEFFAKFLEAQSLAKSLGIKIINGHLLNFARGTGYFCGAASARAMTVTHDGLLTGCLEVVDRNDSDIDTFVVGRYRRESRDFEVDFEKVRVMQKRHADFLAKCKDCYARYHCAGGCPVKAVRMSKDFFDVDLPYCGFTKALVPQLVRDIAMASKI